MCIAGDGAEAGAQNAEARAGTLDIAAGLVRIALQHEDPHGRDLLNEAVGYEVTTQKLDEAAVLLAEMATVAATASEKSQKWSKFVHETEAPNSFYKA